MGALNGSYTSSLLLPPPHTHTLISLPSNTFKFPVTTITLALSSSSLYQSQSGRGTSTTSRRKFKSLASVVVTGNLEEILPPALDSTSNPPPIFDGTTRLYISYNCPYAQRVWITRNCKGLQDKIKLMPINLQNRPAWYKEKVNPANKVPSLEHNNKIIVESLDLIKYIDSNFEGPSLFPSDPVKEKFAEEMFSYNSSFSKAVASSFKEGGVNSETSDAFDYFETALGKFDNGPFLLGEFSLVDIAYAPFIERYKAFLLDVMNYDIVVGRPRFASWLEQMDKITGYKSTQRDPKEHVAAFKQRFMVKT